MNTRGFTLIEVMIVVAIVGILTAIAYPSYQRYVLKSHRTAAQSCLTELSTWMERYYGANMTYSGAALPALACRNDLSSRYTFSFGSGPTATTYTIQAVPIGSQVPDGCGTLAINQAGVRTAAASGCW
ncbi:type IV pilin protein [Tepidimonas charontis]|uniref:Fimbrial protein n=1 Tax=Tepidimonas charontis TaxID=2267262 RepID=A0A554XFZ5_9BURK|nr:type IV pilin protein [Tepidimonas charontis]TSE34689.1 Fimbrial protein [Tepidimonas charontis]